MSTIISLTFDLFFLKKPPAQFFFNFRCNAGPDCIMTFGCRFSAAVTRWTVGLDQRSYSTLGPVSAWVGDRL